MTLRIVGELWRRGAGARVLGVGLALAAAAIVTASCGGGDDGSDGGALRVVATTPIIASLVEEVGGEAVRTTTLMKPGVDPHEFEPSPGDLREIAAAKLIMRHGIGLDDWLDGAIKSAGSSVTSVTVTDGITVRTVGGQRDPHVWHDPANAVAMVDNIERALAQADTSHASTFHENAEAARARLRAADMEIRQLIDGIPTGNRKMVTDHDAFGYFIARYGLTFVGAVIPSTTTQGESSAKQIAELEDTIRREGVKAIFSERSVDPKVARQVAADTGAKVVDTLYGDSLGAPGSPEGTVAGMLAANARAIAEALK